MTHQGGVIDDVEVQDAWNEAGADTLDSVRPGLAAGQHRRVGRFDGDDSGRRPMLLPHPADSGQGSARPDAGDGALRHACQIAQIDTFIDSLPETVKKVAVLDRTKAPGALGEPLYQDVCTVFQEKAEHPVIVGGRYGLGSKDFTPTMVKAVFFTIPVAMTRKLLTNR